MVKPNNRWIMGISGVAVVVTLATTGCVPRPQPPARSRATAASPTATPTFSQPPDIGDAPVTSAAPLPAAPADAIGIAAAFAQAWARPQLPASDWWAALAPLCETSLAARLRTANPANVPATAVTGAPRTAGPVTADAATFAVVTDAGILSVGVTHTPAGWRVSAMDFTRSVHP